MDERLGLLATATVGEGFSKPLSASAGFST
jgi:hypothetical protein